MKICFIVSKIEGIGGITSTVRQLREKLIKKGFEVEAITDVPIRIKGLMNPSFVLKASRLVKKTKADVFHAHGGFNMIPLSKAKVKKVMTMHGVWREAIGFLHNKVAGWIAEKIEEKYLRKVDVLTVVSKKAEKMYRKYNPIYIPNAIDINEFYNKANNPLDLPKNSVLYIGRLSKEKGVKILLEAWRQVHNKFPSAKLFILGSGTVVSNFQAYKKFKTKFVGQIPHDMIPNWLYNASLFVLPSIKETGMPMSVLEAMAMKVPVVATNTGGVPDLIENGESGILVNPNSIDELARAILTGLESDMSQMLEKAYKTLKDGYDLEKVVDRYIQVYESS